MTLPQDAARLLLEFLRPGRSLAHLCALASLICRTADFKDTAHKITSGVTNAFIRRLEIGRTNQPVADKHRASPARWSATIPDRRLPEIPRANPPEARQTFRITLRGFARRQRPGRYSSLTERRIFHCPCQISNGAGSASARPETEEMQVFRLAAIGKCRSSHLRPLYKG